MKVIGLILLSLVCLPSHAQWRLDPANSSLHFVSTKAVHVAEVHRFTELEGAISAAGEAELRINLASVDTKIEIRDQRMRDLLFEVAKYAQATLNVEVDPALLALPVGQSKTHAVEGKLALRGQSVTVGNTAQVSRVSDNRLIVSSQSPVVVKAKDLDLVGGIEKLREVAGLPSISYGVVVTYHLAFVK